MRYVLSFVSLMAFGHVGGCQKESFGKNGEGDKVALEFDALSSERNQGCGRFSLE